MLIKNLSTKISNVPMITLQVISITGRISITDCSVASRFGNFSIICLDIINSPNTLAGNLELFGHNSEFQ